MCRQSISSAPRAAHLAREKAGAATVEQMGIILLVTALFVVIATWLGAGRGEKPGHGLGIRIANRIACGPREPGVCRQHPTVSAYGWDLARAIRWLAPDPYALPRPGGNLVAPVDFRYCQQPGCATPAGDGKLTTANRRLTLFTTVRRNPSARAAGQVPGHGSGVTRSWEITYWFYRPSLGWEKILRRVGPAEIEAASGTRVLLEDSPRLVPLEILPGRNHYELPPGDEAPWRWRVDGLRPGWSA